MMPWPCFGGVDNRVKPLRQVPQAKLDDARYCSVGHVLLYYEHVLTPVQGTCVYLTDLGSRLRLDLGIAAMTSLWFLGTCSR